MSSYTDYHKFEGDREERSYSDFDTFASEVGFFQFIGQILWGWLQPTDLATYQAHVVMFSDEE
jgi:hypothetical protein